MSDPYVVFVPLDATEEELAAITPPKKYQPVSKEIHDERLATCRDCERLFAPTLTCRECLCFMGVKTWIPGSHCPLDKWGAVNA